MSTLLPTLLLPICGLAALLPAQEGAKPKAQEPVKVTNPAPAKDTAANDPAVAAIDKFIAEQKIDKSAAGWKQRLPEPPKVAFPPEIDYFWHVETEVGTVKIRYMPEAAPMHVASGIYLARLGFYDGLVFHRIIPGFMAQGGDPTGSGSGGPGYMMDGEFLGNKKHDKPGLLSMANTGRPRSDGSQFFLTFVPTPHLDGRHSIWGEVVEGMDAVKALEGKGSRENNGMLKTPLKIVKTWITTAAKKGAPATDKPTDKPKEGDKK